MIIGVTNIVVYLAQEQRRHSYRRSVDRLALVESGPSQASPFDKVWHT